MITQSPSKEQLIADIAHAEEKAKSLCGPCADDHERLAYWLRALLASYDQDPVAWEWRYYNHGDGCFGPWERLQCQKSYDEQKARYAGDSEYEFRVLYAECTHPAPSIPAVPDAVTAEDVRWMLKQADHDNGPSCRIEHAEYIGAMMWNACLAAMLNGGKS